MTTGRYRPTPPLRPPPAGTWISISLPLENANRLHLVCTSGAALIQPFGMCAHPINTPTRRQRWRSRIWRCEFGALPASCTVNGSQDSGREDAEDEEANAMERVIHNSELGSSRRVVLVQLRRCCTCCSILPFQAPAALATSSPSPQCCRGWKEMIFREDKGATVMAPQHIIWENLKKKRERKSVAPIAENRAAEHPCRRIQVRGIKGCAFTCRSDCGGSSCLRLSRS